MMLACGSLIGSRTSSAIHTAVRSTMWSGSIDGIWRTGGAGSAARNLSAGHNSKCVSPTSVTSAIMRVPSGRVGTRYGLYLPLSTVLRRRPTFRRSDVLRWRPRPAACSSPGFASAQALSQATRDEVRCLKIAAVLLRTADRFASGVPCRPDSRTQRHRPFALALLDVVSGMHGRLVPKARGRRKQGTSPKMLSAAAMLVTHA